MALSEESFWFSELELGLGLWQGRYQGVDESWLRWYDTTHNWIPTPMELRVQSGDHRQLAQQQAERLRELGINPQEF